MRWFGDPCIAFDARRKPIGKGKRLSEGKKLLGGDWTNICSVTFNSGRSHWLPLLRGETPAWGEMCATQWRLTQLTESLLWPVPRFFSLGIVHFYFCFPVTSKSLLQIPPLSLPRTLIGLWGGRQLAVVHRQTEERKGWAAIMLPFPHQNLQIFHSWTAPTKQNCLIIWTIVIKVFRFLPEQESC